MPIRQGVRREARHGSARGIKQPEVVCLLDDGALLVRGEPEGVNPASRGEATHDFASRVNQTSCASEETGAW